MLPDALEFGLRCVRSLSSAPLLVVVLYAIDRFVLLRQLPNRSARLQWSMAVIIAAASAQISFVDTETALVEHRARNALHLLTVEEIGIVLSLAAMCSIFDRVLMWWRSRTASAHEATSG